MATADRVGSAEEGEACLGCQSSRRDVKGDTVSDVKLASALLRKAIIMMIVTAVLCVLTLAACGFTVYWVNGMRTEILVAASADDDYEYAYDAEYLTGDPDYQGGYDPPPDDTQTATVTASRIRRKKGNKGKGCRGGKRTKAACKCCERKVRSLIESGNIAIPTAKKPTTKPPTTQTPPAAEDQSTERHFFGAAHYTTTVDNDYIRGFFPAIDPGNLNNIVKCKNVTEWNGKLCRNRTFSSPAAPTTLKMFKEAGWMANVTRIFDLKQDGSFVARYTGIYLLYAHVLFYDVKTKQALGLLHESGGGDTNQFRCMESVDYVNAGLGRGPNARYKSCSVNGVLFIKAGDTVRVQSLYADTEIDLTVDATYFGGVLFSST